MLQLIGALVLVYFIGRAAFSVYKLFVKRPTLAVYKKGDSWAVVTGASDGIGLGFVRVLARHGFNVLLVSRSEDKLKKKCAELGSEFRKAKFEYCVSDANQLNTIDNVVEKTTGKDIAVFVNNVGIGQGSPSKLEHVPDDLLTKLVTVNCTYPMLLTKKVLPLMKERRHPGAVVNISSVTAHIHCPFNATYSATKAFNRLFSLALSGECVDDSIDVLSVEPGWVATSLTKMSKGPMVCDAEECAVAALSQLGYVESVPHWKHVAMLSFVRFAFQLVVPVSWQPYLNNKMFREIARKRYGKADL